MPAPGRQYAPSHHHARLIRLALMLQLLALMAALLMA